MLKKLIKLNTNIVHSKQQEKEVHERTSKVDISWRETGIIKLHIFDDKFDAVNLILFIGAKGIIFDVTNLINFVILKIIFLDQFLDQVF